LEENMSIISEEDVEQLKAGARQDLWLWIDGWGDLAESVKEWIGFLSYVNLKLLARIEELERQIDH
jgi:hypothetical protein